VHFNLEVCVTLATRVSFDVQEGTPTVMLNGVAVDADHAYGRNTVAAAVAGLPSLSIPVGLTAGPASSPGGGGALKGGAPSPDRRRQMAAAGSAGISPGRQAHVASGSPALAAGQIQTPNNNLPRVPVAMELVGAPGSDSKLLALGRGFQRLVGPLPDPCLMARWGEGVSVPTNSPVAVLNIA
jgi:hypothetical protein